MKKMMQKIQDLGQKAGQFKQALERAPAQAEQLRDTVLMTAGQLQQMKQDVQGAAMGLRVDNEEKFTQALHEIADGSETFREAGYELTGVDMELSPVQRLIVHLEKVRDADEHTLRALRSANAGKQTMSALLSSLLKAEHVASKVSLSDMDYRGLVIHVGPIPSVRLCWSADEADKEIEEAKPAAIVTSAAAAPTPPPLPLSTTGSFFEPRPRVSARVSASTPSPEVAPVVATHAASPAPPATEQPGHESGSGRKAHGGTDWKRDALERFKKMPDLSKYRR